MASNPTVPTSPAWAAASRSSCTFWCPASGRPRPWRNGTAFATRSAKPLGTTRRTAGWPLSSPPTRNGPNKTGLRKRDILVRPDAGGRASVLDLGEQFFVPLLDPLHGVRQLPPLTPQHPHREARKR